jgi:hypothetical protein
MMKMGMTVVAAVVLVFSCSKDDAPSTPQQQGGGLRAIPTGLTVSTNQTSTVAVSAGVPPYAIAAAPSAGLATAQFVNANIDTAILSITGVTTATGATSVRVRDSSPSPGKTVTVLITKVP